MLNKLSLKQRLSISIISIVVLTLTVITFYGFYKSSELIKDEALHRADEMAKKYALQIKATLDETFTIVRANARALEAMRENGPISREIASKMLNITLEKNSFIYGIGFYWEPNAIDGHDSEFKNKLDGDKDGRFAPWLHRSPKGFVVEPSDSVEMSTPGIGDWYIIPKTTMKESIIEPYLYAVADGSKVMITSPSVPILLDGKFVALSAVDIELKEIQNLVNQIHPYKGSYATLISSEGKYISNPSPQLIDQIVDKKDGNIVKATQSQKGISYELDNMYQILVPIQLGLTGKNWILQIKIPTAEVLAGTKKLSIIQGTFGLAGVLIISIVIYLLSVGVSTPLTEQNRAVELVASTLHSHSENLLRLSKNLSDSSTSQSSALVETSSAMDEINAMVSRNNEAAKKSKLAADQSKKSADEGQAATLEMVQSMEDIKNSTIRISEQSIKGNQEISEIIKIIQSITEKTKVINDIVFQTKLLAFNASVEAARAGEHGKGFSVVAEEVGALSQVSGKAAQEITAMLEESSNKVGNIIRDNQTSIQALITDSTDKVETGLHTVELFATRLQNIVASSEEVSQLVDEIVEASTQQAAGIHQVTKAINELDIEAQQNSSIAKEATHAAEVVNSNSQDLKNIVMKLDQLISGNKG
ncbi:MAG: methyl-accepting chemotaxis protein [Bacteriovorax sp.]|nr:methyl-accepting chemotaxis protein [Bacteriovorax sp.]